jgi:hypothetical protein
MHGLKFIIHQNLQAVWPEQSSYFIQNCFTEQSIFDYPVGRQKSRATLPAECLAVIFIIEKS